MGSGGSYGNNDGGRTLLGTKVFLNIYDLSPANEYLHPIGFGIHHSGVEILGSEYSFASGGGIFQSAPKDAPGAKFRESMELGSFFGGISELNKAISDLQSDYAPNKYNLFTRNCNHFANSLVQILLKKSIPSHVNRLADVGSYFTCLFPQKLLGAAPVNENEESTSNSGVHVHAPPSSRGSSSKAKAFSGQGMTLGSSIYNSSTGTSSMMNGSRSSGTRAGSPDDLTNRREKARRAAMARLEGKGMM